MSLGRNHSADLDVRDIKGDYIKAYLADYEKFTSLGRKDLAVAVAAELRALGHEVEPKAAPTKERAVSPEPLERAVESDAPTKRRGRPAKVAE